jgi:transposase
MHRYELDDWAWAMIEPLLPRRQTRGRYWRDHRQVINGIFWILFSGAPWRDLPERYGPHQTAHKRLTRWRLDGTWDRVLQRLRLKADRAGLLDYSRWLVDSTSIRATRAAAGALKKEGRSPRAAGSRAGLKPRRHRHETAPGDRSPRPSDRRGDHAGSTQRVPDVRVVDECDT